MEHDRITTAVRRLTPGQRLDIVASGGIEKIKVTHANATASTSIMAHLAALPIKLERNAHDEQDHDAYDNADIAEQARIVAEAKRDTATFTARADRYKELVRKVSANPGTGLDGLVATWARVTRPRGEKQIQRMRCRLAGCFSSATQDVVDAARTTLAKAVIDLAATGLTEPASLKKAALQALRKAYPHRN